MQCDMKIQNLMNSYFFQGDLSYTVSYLVFDTEDFRNEIGSSMFSTYHKEA